MKYVKVFGLAAVMAMAMMAFLGAGTASATVLCKTSLTEGCGASGWDYPAGTQIHATLEAGSSATLRNTESSIVNTCTESTVLGKTTNTGSSNETVVGHIEALSFGHCTNTTDVVSLGELEVHWDVGTDNGTLTARTAAVTMNLFGASCTYGAGGGTDLGTVTGGSMATMDVNAVVNKTAGGFLCPGTAVWEAKYTVTSPEPLYISTS